jgi:hypothetical protein
MEHTKSLLRHFIGIFYSIEGMKKNEKLTGGRFATEEALRETHRVLRPGGIFGVIWNIEDCEL